MSARNTTPRPKQRSRDDVDAVRMHVLSAEEEKQYFAAAAKHQDLSDLGRLMLNQGMRPEEVLALSKFDLTLEPAQLQVRSGKSKAARRTLDLTPESRAILARRMTGESPRMFPPPRKPGQHVVSLHNPHEPVCAQ